MLGSWAALVVISLKRARAYGCVTPRTLEDGGIRRRASAQQGPAIAQAE